MQTKNLLITSCSAKVLLVKELKKACEKYNIKLITSDISFDKPAHYFGHDKVILPRMDDPAYKSELESICRIHNIGFILPTRDQDLLWFSDNITSFATKGIKICQSSPEAIKICGDKFRFHEYCLDNNLPIPKNYKKLEDVEFPCIVKQRFSSASKGVQLVNCKSELNKFIASVGVMNSDFFIQKVINDKEYTIDAFFDSAGEMISAIARERIQVVNGEATLSKTVDKPVLVDVVSKLGTSLSFYGHITVQAFCSDNNDVNLIEVNPRFGGASNLGIIAGVNSPERLVASLVGDVEAVNKLIPLKYNLKMLRYSDDLFVQE